MRSPFRYSLSFEGDHLSLSLPPIKAPPMYILGSSHTCLGVKALLTRSETPSQVLKSRQGDCSDTPGWGLHYWSWGHGRWQIWNHIHQIDPGSQMNQWNSAGKGNPSAPVPLTLSHWLWRGAMKAMPTYMSSVTSGGHPQWTRRPRLPPVPYPRPWLAETKLILSPVLKLSRIKEICNEVSWDNTSCNPFGSCGMIRSIEKLPA